MEVTDFSRSVLDNYQVWDCERVGKVKITRTAVVSVLVFLLALSGLVRLSDFGAVVSESVERVRTSLPAELVYRFLFGVAVIYDQIEAYFRGF